MRQETGSADKVQLKMIRAVIVDDNALARHKLRQLVKDNRDVEIVGECATGAETIELVRLAKPELLFLDVGMPEMSGFEVLELLSSDTDRCPSVILVADTDEYAVRAFEVGAVDYLLKPFARERLDTAVQRARDRLDTDYTQKEEPAKKQEERAYSDRLVFKSRGQILFLPAREIRWIKAQENYVRINTGSDSYMLRETISSVENRLDSKFFLRVHRSAIVNLLHVKEVKNTPSGDSTVVLKNGQKVPMSRKYRSVLEALIKSQ